MRRQAEAIDITCPRCGHSGYGKERGGKRRVYADGPANCSMLFEGSCRHWDEAIVKAWLVHDGLREE